MPAPLPRLNEASRARTTPEDAAKVALSFQWQSEYAAHIRQLSKLRSVAATAKATKRDAGSTSEREAREDDKYPLGDVDGSSVTQRYHTLRNDEGVEIECTLCAMAGQSGDGDTEVPSLGEPSSTSGVQTKAVRADASPPLASSEETLSEPAQKATLVHVAAGSDGQAPSGSDGAYPQSSNSGAVMVTLSTTQAMILVVVALSMAATVGAFLLWFTLAFELHDRAVHFIYSTPPLSQRLIVAYYGARRWFYQEAESYLEAMIARLKTLQGSIIQAQGLPVDAVQ